ncbi:hypothetical protein [Okeania sp.]|uniref:hypothetical protein n=1 Tax=Okeania sp. TaxID=3100323 RepID=UPI002B4AC1D6|nr:hypothetical protein [Okeania sp.]MEB3341704.1 hypothetical protein [Okeania sp.]
MAKCIVSIILTTSVLTGLNIISAVKSNFIAQKQLQFDQQESWELLIAQTDETEQDITPGQTRGDEQQE